MKTISELFPTACSDAIKAHGNQTLQEALDTCERADWMFWIINKMEGQPGFPDKMALVKMACRFARLAIRFVPKGELRPLKAIEAAEAWVTDPNEANMVAARAAAGADENKAQSDIIREIWPKVVV